MSTISTPDAAWAQVEDRRITVGERQVRILAAPSRRRRGRQEPQLLVHGLGASAISWIEVIGALAEHGPVVAVDLPGCGQTTATSAKELTVEAYVDFLVELADALGWERFTLHGNSMGGLVGTLLAAERPDLVERLVLVSPALPPASPLRLLVPHRPTLSTMAPIVRSSLSAALLGVVGTVGPELDERRNRDLLRLIFSDPDGVRPELIDVMAAEFSDADHDLATARRRAVVVSLLSIAGHWLDGRKVWKAIREVQAPTIVIGGTADALVPVSVLRQVLARRPDWHGAVIDERRHALMLEDPAAYLDLVTDWRRTTARAA